MTFNADLLPSKNCRQLLYFSWPKDSRNILVTTRLPKNRVWLSMDRPFAIGDERPEIPWICTLAAVSSSSGI